MILFQSQQLRAASCCPCFLIGISGCTMAVSGAVFADRFISQRLTDDIYLGGGPRLSDQVYKVASILRLLKNGISDLDSYYANLTLPAPLLPSSRSVRASRRAVVQPSSLSPGALYPQVTSLAMPNNPTIRLRLDYQCRLLPRYSDKAVFKASACFPGEEDQKDVVVKFTDTYCSDAHNLLANAGLAPKLHHCENVSSVAMFVVVMDFVEGTSMSSSPDRQLTKAVVDDLRKAVTLLHDNGFVFGDLRPPNIILSEVKESISAKLVDYDWSGRFGNVCYPADINLEDSIGWHKGVERGGEILQEHDRHMFKQLTGEDLSQTIELRDENANC